jgi:carbonic anhydrase/SulP family sulfate permease
MVVIAAVALALGFEELGGIWQVGATHLVQVPDSGPLEVRLGSLHSPDFSAITRPGILLAAVTIAAVASLETLLNLEAVDKLDPEKRASPPNRELLAQGVGNMASGFLGGLPITSVVVRSSVGISAGAQTRMACFVHGLLLLVLVLALPRLLNMIPLACLAAILMVTGFKLTTPDLFKQMWSEGRNQFLPFVGTIVAIVLTDLLIGILIGMLVAIFFILQSNLKSPLRQINERHVSGEVLRLEFANQVTFLNRASLLETLHAIPRQSQVVLDARNTVYMDPDIVDLIREFEDEIAPAHEIRLSLVGFKDHYDQEDRITYVDVATREIQDRATPQEVLRLLKDGNQRFVSGQQIMRDPRRQVGVTSSGQFPLAVVLACMDSRIATEMIFDLGLGDVFSVRVAGNIASKENLGSMEYGCAVSGAKLLLVLGHTRCGAVTATIDQIANGTDAAQAGPLENLAAITGRIAKSVNAEVETSTDRNGSNEVFVRRVTVLNVRRTMEEIVEKSDALRNLIDEERILLAGGIYDVATGEVEFFDSV